MVEEVFRAFILHCKILLQINDLSQIFYCSKSAEAIRKIHVLKVLNISSHYVGTMVIVNVI